jgi:hypothetical protein
MSSLFRPTRPEDAPAISLFMQEVFSMASTHPGLAVRHMHWKYWCDHPEWEGARGYVMERDQQIVAHGSVVPLTCVWEDRRFKMVDLIDWAARPGNPGAGITLLKRVSQMVDGVFIAGGTAAAQKVFDSLGFREITKASVFALPLAPLARFLREPQLSWRGPARLARNAVWLMRGSTTPPKGWSARRLSKEGVTNATFPTPHPRAQAAVFERTPASIAHLLECPAAPAQFYLIERDGSTRGYFVLTQAIAQCRIAEAWVEPGNAEDWPALYSLAAHEAARRPGTMEIVTMVTNDGAAQEGLRRSGFRARGHIPLRFSIKGGSYPGDIRYQMVDNDNAWLHDGTTGYWT